jgi:ferric-dicitrate binding protein FerR (iron transport regulator)
VFGGVLLIMAALLLSGGKDNPVLVQTEYGNLKSIVLPDSSSVMLNGNSTIRFNETWRKDKTREVWLEGEAFFDIRHINKNFSQIEIYERFIVHTKDLTVEVLGTSFNIRQRRGKTEVVLQSGKIKVAFIKGKKEEIELKPGDRITYDAAEDKLLKGTTNAENASAWKVKKLLLDDPTIDEVIEYLEDVFGKKIVLANAELGKRKLEGPIQLTTLDDALFVLSTVLNAEIIKKDSTIIIRSR